MGDFYRFGLSVHFLPAIVLFEFSQTEFSQTYQVQHIIRVLHYLTVIPFKEKSFIIFLYA